MEPWFAALARPTAVVPSAAAHKLILGIGRGTSGAWCWPWMSRRRSQPDLTQAITTWAEHWNNNPTPFIWKATAEDLITKVKRGTRNVEPDQHADRPLGADGGEAHGLRAGVVDVG
jgi:hypothetical protein